MLDKVYTSVASPNIALVKYWGKRNDVLILPYNSSVSMTVARAFSTKTSVLFTHSVKEDIFYLDGKRQDLNDPELSERLKVIEIMRKIAKTDAKAVIYSVNNFPTSAGLASSASGISALVYAINSALELGLDARSLSIIARQGSGSACRSLFGGFVIWHVGVKEDGSDSYAEQIANEGYWPELVDLIAIVSEGKKKVSSRAGMKQTVETSELYAQRPKIAEAHAKAVSQAILAKDFPTLAEYIMKDSNSMHAVMLDTYPPLLYLNDASREVINAITELNEKHGKPVAAYTFDAGPNAHVFTLQGFKGEVLENLKEIEGIEKIVEVSPGPGPEIVKEGFEKEIQEIVG